MKRLTQDKAWLGQGKQVVWVINSVLQVVLIPLILFFILAILIVTNNNVVTTIEKNTLIPVDSRTKIYPYPFIQTVQMPEVSAKAAIIVDADSQVIIFSKNSHAHFSMASTTKIMTALTALDYYTNESILTVNSYNSEGSRLGMEYGERFYFEDLLYAMLLPSANDAAETIAENYPGGRDAFIADMNKKAKSFNLENTHFSDPTGLDDDGNYTTVVDMSRLASIAIKNAELLKITGTKTKIIKNVDNTREYVLNNLNRLLGIAGVFGMKTGTTEKAGEVLVTSAVVKGHTFIIVVMNSKHRFDDTKALLLFISENVQYIAPDIKSAGFSGSLDSK